MTNPTLPSKPEGQRSAIPHNPDLPAKQKGRAATVPERADMRPKASGKGTRVGKSGARSGKAQRSSNGRTDDQTGARPTGEGGEGYLRLRVKVDNGRLEVVGSKLVEGPLAMTSAFHGGFAYEVTAGGRLLHAGAIPDLGEFRSFAHPDGTPMQRGHHRYRVETYEFIARMPVNALRAADPGSVEIALFKVKHPDRPDTLATPLSDAPLLAQRSRQLREIGRVIGIPHEFISASLEHEFARRTTTEQATQPLERRMKSEGQRDRPGDEEDAAK